ncbi:MAG TPA: DUF1800 family protein [Bryobacteraceae bacterium]|nr:DUF1800 family protein [Bryobacteraceae bacterium]
MPRKPLTLALAGLILMATGFAAKKPKPASSVSLAAPKILQMTDDQKALHALNRLTFGPRPGDLEQVKQMGLQQWIDQQLHPESIPENPALLEKLAPLDTLDLSTQAMLQKYPSQQMIRAMSEGRIPLPEDKETRAAVQTAIERYRRRQAADDADAAIPTTPQVGEVTIGNMETKIQTPPPPPPGGRVAPETLNQLPLSQDQKQALLRGTPESRLDLIESLPEDQQVDVIEALPQPMRNRIAAAGSPALRRRVEVLSAPGQVVNRDLTEGKLLRAIYSNRQLEEVLTDFWFNHFNVYLNKGADRYMVTSYERDVIRPHVLGKFKDLLLATAESPAMLFYLDNWESAAPGMVRPFAPANQKKAGLNENYGRELMELHTLGVDGGYTQQDVTEVARCFTGWTIRQPQQGGGFFFNPRMHDRGEKHVLGITIPAGGGIEDGLKVLDILAKNPATARFISKSLAVRFVSDNPPDELIDRMADTFTKTDGDLREVMETMLHSDEFWAASNFRSKLKSPLEMVVSAVRAVNADVENPQQMANLMNTLGEPLYLKIEPTGYTNRGADWLNSASLLARMNFANSLAQGKMAGVKVDLTQFSGGAAQIEHNILLADASRASQAAIQAGISESSQPAEGPRIAGLTMGSPDFQRR